MDDDVDEELEVLELDEVEELELVLVLEDDDVAVVSNSLPVPAFPPIEDELRGATVEDVDVVDDVETDVVVVVVVGSLAALKVSHQGWHGCPYAAMLPVQLAHGLHS